jgi:predicted glycogen debranching enzyme
LVAPRPGTNERFLYLARYDERLVEPTGEAWQFSVARYPDALAPRGDLALESFEHAPCPRATYRLGRARLVRSIQMLRGRHAVLVRYELAASDSDAPCRLELRPILPFRQADALTIENQAFQPAVEPTPGGFTVQPYSGLPVLHFSASIAPRIEPDPIWFRNLVFTDDRARGYGGREDEPSPACLSFELAPGESLVIAAALEKAVADPARAFADEARRRSRAALAAGEDELDRRLSRAADAFLYRARVDDGSSREERAGVLAGFPWFQEWGRDTFIALPGLTLARDRLEDCAEVLVGALPFLKNGLLPNVFGRTPEDSHYGAADAALWFARAVLLYERAGGKRSLIKEQLQPALESIAEAYFGGTDLGLAVDEDGLLTLGSPDSNPTWMDARSAGRPVTPRHGTPVEIAALWCSLLAHLEELARSKAARRVRAAHKHRARRAFLARFWLEDQGYLADVWRDGAQDRSVRPNMVLAAALELAPLTKRQRARIVARAEAELLTPRGLRTLSPNDPDYCQRYTGGPDQRDAAYHQGTVWPWLLGFFTEAALRAGKPTKARKAWLAGLWKALEPELDRGGLDHVSEVFDGDPPHAAGGCFAQAWNTAEWLRARRMLAEGPA